MHTAVIRPIQKKENEQIASIIRGVLEDFGVPKVGTAYADAALNAMFEAYDKKNAAYFVLEENGTLIGGGGVAQLDNYDGKVCELQKMYFLPQARGRGLGTQMIDICLQKASEMGYEKCYLETMSYMEAAQKLYQRYGFQYLSGPMGDTGHHACGVHMIKDL
ncbi:GNAT family N-acetyltransferase [Altibacter sp.]|uniref:GNAT family N-acetyltransferase n=1 Tax=Altibacter sp. TaxID=2024823 RepID=UPI0025BB9D19|nr:GNAT family N-acetyltransferase [Altibacter sp.]